MKKKDKKELQSQPLADLVKEEREVTKKITEKMRDAGTKQVKNVHEVKALRKTLAIILTFIRQKELVNG